MDKNNSLTVRFEVNESGKFDLISLADTFKGLDVAIKEIFIVSNISGDLEVQIKEVRKGSILVILWSSIHAQIPFDKVSDFLNFLLVASPAYHTDAVKYFNDLKNINKTVNDYFIQNPFNMGLALLFIEKFFPKMIKLVPKFKLSPLVPEEDKGNVPLLYAQKINSMISAGRFKKLTSGIVENKISKIVIGDDIDKNYTAEIDTSNFEGYISDEEKILPEFVNGQEVKLTGEMLAMQSTRGEILKFKILNIDTKNQLLVAHPDENKKTEDYKEFYKKQVLIDAEIYRLSLYKRPELILRNVQLLQTPLI